MWMWPTVTKVETCFPGRLWHNWQSDRLGSIILISLCVFSSYFCVLETWEFGLSYISIVAVAHFDLQIQWPKLISECSSCCTSFQLYFLRMAALLLTPPCSERPWPHFGAVPSLEMYQTTWSFLSACPVGIVQELWMPRMTHCPISSQSQWVTNDTEKDGNSNIYSRGNFHFQVKSMFGDSIAALGTFKWKVCLTALSWGGNIINMPFQSMQFHTWWNWC